MSLMLPNVKRHSGTLSKRRKSCEPLGKGATLRPRTPSVPYIRRRKEGEGLLVFMLPRRQMGKGDGVNVKRGLCRVPPMERPIIAPISLPSITTY